MWTDTGIKFTQPSIAEIYHTVMSPKLQHWWTRHELVPSESVKEIDWQTTRLTMPRLTPSERVGVTKTASENCGVGTTLVTWKHQSEATCPRCSHPHEDTKHIAQCQGHGAARKCAPSLRRLRTLLKKLHTSPDIRRNLIKGLERWHRGKSLRSKHLSQELRAAVQQQGRIGWHRMFEGLFAQEWQVLQQQCLDAHQSRRSAAAWAQSFLPAVVRIGKSQWKHRND